MSVRATKAPWPHNKVYTDEETKKIFISPEHVDRGIFQGENYALPEWIPVDYLSDFELFLQEINQHFGPKYRDDGMTPISFEDWFRANYKEICTSKSKFPHQEFYFECSVMIAHIAYSPKHQVKKSGEKKSSEVVESSELVLKYVVTRPCAEGIGLYKLLLYQLCLIVKRQSWSKLLIHHCLSENIGILENYFKFTRAEAYEDKTYVNFFVDLDRINSEICVSRGDVIDLEGLPWGLNSFVEEAHPKLGLKLKMSSAGFPYATQLNSQDYVDAKYENRADKQFDYRVPNLGYPDAHKRRVLHRLFSERRDAYSVINARNRQDAMHATHFVTRYVDEQVGGRTRSSARQVVVPRIQGSDLTSKYIQSGVADALDFPAPTNSSRPEDAPQLDYIEQMKQHLGSRQHLDSELESAALLTSSARDASSSRGLLKRLTDFWGGGSEDKRSKSSSGGGWFKFWP